MINSRETREQRQLKMDSKGTYIVAIDLFDRSVLDAMDVKHQCLGKHELKRSIG